MAEESFLQTVLAKSPAPSAAGTSPQAFPPVSSVPTADPPPPSGPQAAPQQEGHWSNAAIRFLLSQCKEHVEALNIVTMQQHRWARIHEQLIAEQGIRVPRTGTSNAPVDLFEVHEDVGQPSHLQSLPRAISASSTDTIGSTESSPRTRATNLVGSCNKGTSSKPIAKRARIDRSWMDTLDKMVESSAEIEKLRTEAFVTMYKEIQLQHEMEHQKNRELVLQLFESQRANIERMTSMFVDAFKKNVK